MFVIEKNFYRIVNIRKPLFETKEGDTVGVYDREINLAIKFRQMLKVISKNGEAKFYPKWIKKNCPTISKVFLRPNEPMILYKIFIPKKKKITEEQKLEWLFREGILQ